jgi:hypothetical protein
LFQGSSGSEGVEFSAAMFVSGEADPFHLSARSPRPAGYHIPKRR